MNKILIKPTFPLTLLLLIMSACSYINNEYGKEEAPSLSNQTERYLRDVKFISQMSRISGSAHHKSVQIMCAQRFNELGFDVELHHYGTGINVIGIYPGKQNSTEKILVSAHYDTVAHCNGADDNASGIAGVFETARLLTSKEKKYDRSLVVACWDEEEKDTKGSIAYVEREKNNATDIKMSYVYEMIGYRNNKPDSQQIPPGFDRLYPQQVKQIRSNQNRGDFIALIYDDKATEMLSTITSHAHQQSLPVLQFKVSAQLKRSPLAVDLRRSDHSAFWDADYPAMMITDTANFRNPNYHCVNGSDKVESLDAKFAIKIINTLSKTIEENLDK
jgi:Zn-dependent M28 family amino/carboxypeptidase